MEFSSLEIANDSFNEDTENLRTFKQSNHNKQKNYKMDDMDAEEFLNLTYELLLKIKGIKNRNMIRRKSCDLEYFGGKVKNSCKLDIEENTVYDLLYHNFVLKAIKKMNKNEIIDIKLPWYLEKNNLKSRINSLRILAQNIAQTKLKVVKNGLYRDDSIKLGGISPLRPRKSIKNPMLEFIDILDLQKYTQILTVCLNEPLNSVSITEEQINANIIHSGYTQSTKITEMLSKFKRAVYVAFRYITEKQGTLNSLADIKNAIKKYLVKGANNAVLRRFKTKKMVTQIQNKMTLLSGLVFNVVNTNPEFKFTQVKLSDETINIMKNLLSETQNQDNIRRMMEENRNKYLQEQLKLEQENSAKKSRLQTQFKGLVMGRMKFAQILKNNEKKMTVVQESKSKTTNSKTPSLVDLAFLLNRKGQEEQPIKRQMSQAEISMKRMNSMQSNTMLDLDSHLNLKKVGNMFNKISISQQQQPSNARQSNQSNLKQQILEEDIQSVVDTNYSEKKPRKCNSDLQSKMLLRDLLVNNHQKQFSTMKKGLHGRSYSQLTGFKQSTDNKGPFIIKTGHKKKMSLHHSQSVSSFKLHKSVIAGQMSSQKLNLFMERKRMLLPYSKIQRCNLLG